MHVRSVLHKIEVKERKETQEEKVTFKPKTIIKKNEATILVTCTFTFTFAYFAGIHGPEGDALWCINAEVLPLM